MYETFEHTADLGLRIVSPEIERLFEEASQGLCSLIVENPESVRAERRVQMGLAGTDLRLLFFDWLCELLYRFHSDRWLVARSNVRTTDRGLEAEVWGETLDQSRHRIDHEVKAITYHGLRVEPAPGGWLAEVIVDI